jgi:arylsulfatase A-like enzyme
MAAATSAHPNIVPIMTDQHRGDFSKAEGFPLDTTPFLDQLGERGARVRRAYVPMPACAPSRTSIFTGRFPKATRVRQNSAGDHVVAPTNLVALLRGQGYSTHLAGKNHSFLRPEDFDSASFYVHTGRVGGEKTPDEQRMDDWLAALDHGDFPAEEFRPVYAELGFGGLPYGEGDDQPLHFDREGPTFDELNSFTQSGYTKMVRMGRWKLLFDLLGRGELYDLEEDPGELRNRFADPALAHVRLKLVEELLAWTIRTEDDLPSARYTPKRAPRNWYAPYR